MIAPESHLPRLPAAALTDRTGALVGLDAAMCRLLGSAPAPKDLSLASWLGEPAARELLEAVFERAETREAPTRLELGPGLTMVVRLRASQVVAGSLAGPLALLQFLPGTARSNTVEVADPHLRQMLDRIGEGFLGLDRSWRVRYVNVSAERFLSRPREELLGRVIWDELPEVRGTVLERELRRALDAGLHLEFEQEHALHRRWFAFRAYPSESGISVFFRDIHESRMALEALRDSESRYRSIFENSIDGIFLCDADVGEIIAANPAACRMLRQSEDELKHLGRTGISAPEDARVIEFLEQRARSGSARAEVTLVRKDGSRLPAEVSSGLFETGHGELRTSMTIRDLSSAKRAEARLRLLVDAGTALASSLDDEATFRALATLAVPRFAHCCAVEVADGAGLRSMVFAARDASGPPKLLPLVGPSPVPVSRALLARVLEDREPIYVPRMDARWLHTLSDGGDGTALEAAGLSSLLLVPIAHGGEPMGVACLGLASGSYEPDDLGVAQGLADRTAMAVAHARMFARLREAKRLRDEMLEVVSHDLRNPLNSIGISANVLARHINRPELVAITRSLKRADRLLDDLLTSAMIDSGKLPLFRTREPVEELLDEVVELYRPQAESKHIALAAHAAPGMLEVSVDRHRVVQLLSNLVGNAVKFTGEGGRIELGAALVGGELTLSVADSGPGIEASEMPHLFDRFWQGARGQRLGTGLGLAIVKGIAEAHGGTVRVSSEVGRGSTFTVRLPLREELTASSALGR